MRRTWHSIVRPVFSPPREWWLCSTSSIRPLKRWAMPFVCGRIGCARRCSMHRQPGTRDARTQDLAHHGQQIEDRRFSTGQPALGEGHESRVSEPHTATLPAADHSFIAAAGPPSHPQTLYWPVSHQLPSLPAKIDVRPRIWSALRDASIRPFFETSDVGGSFCRSFSMATIES